MCQFAGECTVGFLPWELVRVLIGGNTTTLPESGPGNPLLV